MGRRSMASLSSASLNWTWGLNVEVDVGKRDGDVTVELVGRGKIETVTYSFWRRAVGFLFVNNLI
jgi:hypothetical protein